MSTLKKRILEMVANRSITREVAKELLTNINDQSYMSDQIAIIGTSVCLSNIHELEEYWNFLKNGETCIREYPENRREDSKVLYSNLYSEDMDIPPLDGSEGDPYVKGGYLDEVDKFDAAFFNISPEDAQAMDPYQRILLETTWKAIENSNYTLNKINGMDIGVYIGRDHTYETNYDSLSDKKNMKTILGSWSSILAGRIAYAFNLKGPCEVIDTACSSSLVAVHNACRALKNRECDVAIAGGIGLGMGRLNIKNDMMKVESDDFVIRTFDNEANGTVWGEGAGIVVLKPLKKAIEDNDNIFSVILGSAVNCDGASGEISTPNAQAQKDLLVKAWEKADIMPETISYIETHGTGTKIGDPIEVKAITKAFAKYTNKKQFCAIGSVKPNIGHLVAASGIASLLKVIASMKHRQLPATINFSNVNSLINFVDSPLYICDKIQDWQPIGETLRAGVSSFGFSGTNCHILLEEAPKQARKNMGDNSRTLIFPISAKSPEAMRVLLANYISFLQDDEQNEFYDICYSASICKDHFRYRLAVLADSKKNLLERLKGVDYENIAEDAFYGVASEQYEDVKTSNIEEEALQKVCERYVKGATINWNSFYYDLNPRKVILPQYPLNRVRHWVQITDQTSHENINKDDETVKEYNLSNAQERMWVAHQLTPDMKAYNLPMLIKYDFAVDIDALEYAINFLIKRHDSFRTIIKEQNGVLKQIVENFSHISLEMMDLSKCDNKEELFKKILKENNDFVFDLTKRLFYIKLYKLDSEKYYLYLTIHHIISDAWSQKIITTEFMQVYNAYKENKKPLLPAINVQYVDWVNIKKQWLLTSECASMEKYWLDEMCKPIPQLELPIDFTRPKTKSYNGGFLTHHIEGAQRLKQIASHNGVSMQILLLTLYFILMRKLSGQDDIIIGIPLAERSDKNIENTIGLFVNTLCIRVQFDKDSTFDDLLNQTKSKSINGYKNGKYPFDQLVTKVNPERDIATDALFSSFFQFYDLFPPENDSSLFDLYLLCRLKDNDIEFKFNYNTDIFQEKTIQRFACYYANLINTILEKGTHIELSNMELMNEQDKKDVICNFNQTDCYYDNQLTLNAIFENQVAKTPDKVAVIYDNCSYTYHQVNEKANQLAYRLRECGVTSDTIVAIIMERSAEMMIGILAILKAGAAYLPIDVTFPEERIKYILIDSQTNWILTQRKYKDKVEFSGVKICLDDEALYQGECQNLIRINNSKNLAYVIYTSGTTGMPKGVLIEHQAAVNRLLWMQNAYPMDENAVFLQKTPYTFDVSVWELFLWFFVGASVCFLRPGEEKNPEAIVETVHSRKITVMHFVPSMLNAFLRYVEACEEENRLSSLKYIFASGEALQVNQVNLFHKLFSHTSAELHNLYGPTEATVDVTYFDCKKYDSESSIPIGYPISNVRMYIVDVKNNILPIGVAGELCIAGDALARGYINKPELTCQKFQMNPFNREQNPFRHEERIYRTGDLAKWLTNGTIEYLGRIDDQVKIRGYRIELEDIRRNLLKHENISEAVVVVKNNDQDQYLCAYYVGDGELKPEQIKDFLALHLPEYMIPTRYIQLEKMPLSKNGKIDIKALPVIREMDRLLKEHKIPGNGDQEDILRIWSELLAIDVRQISITDRFFDIGGNSILLIHMHRMLKEKFEINLNVLDLFSLNTIEKIADFILSKKEQNVGCKNKQVSVKELYSEYIFDINENINQKLSEVTKKYGYSRDAILLSAFISLLSHISGKTVFDVRNLAIADKEFEYKREIDVSNVMNINSLIELALEMKCDEDEYQLYLGPISMKEQETIIYPVFEKNSNTNMYDDDANLIFSHQMEENKEHFTVYFRRSEIDEEIVKTLIKKYANMLAAMIKNL